VSNYHLGQSSTLLYNTCLLHCNKSLTCDQHWIIQVEHKQVAHNTTKVELCMAVLSNWWLTIIHIQSWPYWAQVQECK